MSFSAPVLPHSLEQPISTSLGNSPGHSPGHSPGASSGASSDSPPLVLDIGSSSDSEDSIVSARQSHQPTPVNIENGIEAIQPIIQAVQVVGSNAPLLGVPVLRREGRTGAYFPEDKAKAVEYFLKHSKERGIDKKKAADELGVKYITLYQWVRDAVERTRASQPAARFPRFHTADDQVAHQRNSDAFSPQYHADTIHRGRYETNSPFHTSHVGIADSVKRRRTENPSPTYASFFENSSSLSDMLLQRGVSLHDQGQRMAFGGGYPRSRVGDVPLANLRQPHLREPCMSLDSDGRDPEDDRRPPTQLVRRTFTGGPPGPRQPPPQSGAPTPTVDRRHSVLIEGTPKVRTSTVDNVSHLPHSDVRQSEVSNSLAVTCSIIRSTVKCSDLQRTEMEASRVENSEILGSTLAATTVKESQIWDAELTNCEVENSKVDGGVHEGKIYHNVVISGSEEQTPVEGNGI
ncbi:hypothetical protein P152DRAFT_456326 [Eremomyces bilateralis CBS 781.70]|uniref:Uncharacterized protein n=1 Tax=Eremomyces bilateralis CBS 781.70 TaxID=1392243 RepID=A0A6G1GBQ9_9PEZI|nr:uncharacterized protein P152DRAFT_456326 [Eremomyces bilateralis CBS 781.70]KAF1815279.1 hypothetical protein P152DRAFT_456326 [Eremomyces bilateralis CBS 781.70]